MPGGEGPAGATGAASANPFMSAVNQMFKDFEQVSSEKGADEGQPGAADPQLNEFL